jgi:hypothetical protein
MAESGGTNLYGYANNNPATFVDPLGLYWLTVPEFEYDEEQQVVFDPCTQMYKLVDVEVTKVVGHYLIWVPTTLGDSRFNFTPPPPRTGPPIDPIEKKIDEEDFGRQFRQPGEDWESYNDRLEHPFGRINSDSLW